MNRSCVIRPDGTSLLISYTTVVAAILPNGKKIQTEAKYSRTTSRHLSSWGVTNDNRWEKVPQKILDIL
jgi:hypothetical protein